MREDYLEALEKMFPKGYVILYPTDQLGDCRISWNLPDDRDSEAFKIMDDTIEYISGDRDNDEKGNG